MEEMSVTIATSGSCLRQVETRDRCRKFVTMNRRCQNEQWLRLQETQMLCGTAIGDRGSIWVAKIGPIGHISPIREKMGPHLLTGYRGISVFRSSVKPLAFINPSLSTGNEPSNHARTSVAGRPRAIANFSSLPSKALSLNARIV